MDLQRFFVKGKTYSADDPQLQQALEQVYDTPERPRCMCVRGGIEMYIAKHRLYVIKRMPETGPQHDPTCPSFEHEPGLSGLGELMGESIIEHSPGSFELRTRYALSRAPGRTMARAPSNAGDVTTSKHLLSLRATMHFLFQFAGFNRWSPAMEGKRNQGVLQKYLMQAAESATTKGMPLSERLYVPEQFTEEDKAWIARRRREKLAVLDSPEDDAFKMALIVGEFKAHEPSPSGRKLWIKHMADAPIFIAQRTWEKMEWTYATVLEGPNIDTDQKPRIVVCALIYAKRERTYQVDAASFMLTTRTWIPIDGVYELNLINTLVREKRRFIKPLRYDAKTPAVFANALLLDAAEKPVPLHVMSDRMGEKEREAKERVLEKAGPATWVWHTGKPMPALPVARPMPKANAGTAPRITHHQHHATP